MTSPAFAPAAAPPSPSAAAAPNPMANTVPTPGTRRLATAAPPASPALAPTAPPTTAPMAFPIPSGSASVVGMVSSFCSADRVPSRSGNSPLRKMMDCCVMPLPNKASTACSAEASEGKIPTTLCMSPPASGCADAKPCNLKIAFPA